MLFPFSALETKQWRNFHPVKAFLVLDAIMTNELAIWLHLRADRRCVRLVVNCRMCARVHYAWHGKCLYRDVF